MELTADEILDKALELPDEQRGRLASLLIDSLDGVQEGEIEAAWKAEVRGRRIDELDAGEVRTVALEEVRARLARSRGQ